MIRVKFIALLTRKPGLSRDAFIAYYETSHAPLILRLTPTIALYRRNFRVEAGSFGSPVEFDCVTEIGFASAADHAAALARWAEPAVAAEVAADEANVFDREKTRMFVVELRESELG